MSMLKYSTEFKYYIIGAKDITRGIVKDKYLRYRIRDIYKYALEYST